MATGRKFDGGKLEYGLLPPFALEETVKVLTFGAQKYEPENSVIRKIWVWCYL